MKTKHKWSIAFALVCMTAVVGAQSADKVQQGEDAYLGVISKSIAPAIRHQMDLPDGIGLMVEYIDPDSPAHGALHQYDVLGKLNDQWLVTHYQLAVLIRMHEPGEKITLTVYRHGQPKELEVTLIGRSLPPLTSFEQRPYHLQSPQLRNFHVPFELDEGDLPDLIQRLPNATNCPHLRMRMHRRHDLASRLQQKSAMRVETMVDGDLSLTLTVEQGKKHLLVKEADAVLFKGQIDTPEQRKTIPEKAHDLLEKLEKSSASVLELKTLDNTGNPTVL